MRSFCTIFRKNYMFYAILCTPFLVLCLGMVFSLFCTFLDHFTPTLTIIECSMTPYGHPQFTVTMEEQKSIEIELTTDTP